jgi:integrase
LEAGVDILTISRLLGHSSFATTMIYLHCRRNHMLRAPSPLDWLPTKQLPKWEDPTNDPTSDPQN